MNRTMKSLTVFFLLLAITSLGSIAWAGELSMMAAKDHLKASGTLDLNQDKVSIQAEGLKPRSSINVELHIN